MSRRNGYSATWYIVDLHDPWTLRGAKEFVQRKIGQRIGKTFLKTELVGILAVNNTGVFVLRELQPIDGELLELISQINEYGEPGRCCDALRVAVDKYDYHPSIKPSWTKEIYLLCREFPKQHNDLLAFLHAHTTLPMVILVSDANDLDTTAYTDVNNKLEVGLIDEALDQVRAPNIREVFPTAHKNFLYIGAEIVDGVYRGGVQIPIKVLKGTAKEALPSAKLVNKHSIGAKALAGRKDLVEVDGLAGHDALAGGDLIRSRAYFVRPKEGQEEEEAAAKDVTETDCKRVFRYGATLINVPTAEEGGMTFLALPQGLDVLCCVSADSFSREFLMGEIFYVHPDPTSPKAQLEFSAFARALLQKKLYFLARYCRTTDSKAPILVIVRPSEGTNNSGETITILQYCRVPYADDYRKFHFNSLTSVTTTSGKILTSNHRLLPTDEQQRAMDRFVDACDATWVDSNGTDFVPEVERDDVATTWYTPEMAYNPALHRLKEAIFHAVITDDLVSYPVPPPHPAITKYLEPSEVISHAQKEIIAPLINALDIKKAPPRVTRQSKTIEAQLAQEDKTIDLAALGVGSDLHAESKVASAEALTEDEDDFAVSTINPVSDITLHLKTIGNNSIPQALWNACEDVVVELVNRAYAKQNYDKAVGVLTIVRHTTRQKQTPGDYRRMIDRVASLKTDFRERLAAEGLTEN